MNRLLILSAILLALLSSAHAQSPAPATAPARGRGNNNDAFYKLGPDSLQMEGVPHGKFVGPTTLPSQAYPGTQHTYWVYVPAQYDPAIPTALMIFNDGQAFKSENGDVRAQNVLDNLIWRREIPVMLGVFINPGRTSEQPEPPERNGGWGDNTTNRPEEYNSINDKYARVICDELMPALNRDYNISKDPQLHGIGGASSGGIAAFVVAWHRPDDFRKVFTIVGSFVNLGNRQGHTFPELVAQSEKKPFRIYMQDGRNDNRNPARGGNDPNSNDWFYQNTRLADALSKKGYDVTWSWGIGNHGQKQGGMMLPEMMRWLWRDAQTPSVDRADTVERAFRRPSTNPSGSP